MSSKFQKVRAFKKFYFKFGLHRLSPKRNAIFLGQMAELSRWISKHRGKGKSDNLKAKYRHEARFELYKHVIDTEGLNGPVDYFEFGVAKGKSFRWWLKQIDHPEARFLGFDTFTGLPEDWGPFKAGAMSNGNAPPEIEGNRHEFFQGVFQQTLPMFLKTYKPERRKILMMDADLYSSTLFVLTSMTPFLNPGDIILFDEFNVPMHEFRAYRDWTSSYYVQCEFLGEVNNFYQVAFKVGIQN